MRLENQVCIFKNIVVVYLARKIGIGKRLRKIRKIYNKIVSLENQIILFTCTKREEEILNKLNIKYNLIEL